MDIGVKQKFEAYPHEVSESLEVIRTLIINTAKEEVINDLVETLKWG